MWLPSHGEAARVEERIVMVLTEVTRTKLLFIAQRKGILLEKRSRLLLCYHVKHSMRLVCKKTCPHCSWNVVSSFSLQQETATKLRTHQTKRPLRSLTPVNSGATLQEHYLLPNPNKNPTDRQDIWGNYHSKELIVHLNTFLKIHMTFLFSET